MTRQLLALIYVLGLGAAEFLRWRFRWTRSPFPTKSRIVSLDLPWGERLVLLSILIGIWALPLMYIATDWLSAFDYQLPAALSLAGVALFLLSLWLRYRSQKDLDRNWSPSLVIWEGHELITDGIYRWLRHPLYSSLWIWGIAQPFLLHNWLAGWLGIFAAAMVHLIRLPREEAMLVNHFGEAYNDYRRQTGGIFPKFGILQ